MKTSLKKDLSILTTINEATLGKFTDKIEWCISDAVEKSIYQRDVEADIDVGIGHLIINFDNNQIKYRFVPSEHLENTIVDTVVNETNGLVVTLENSLIQKMTNVYKDFC